MLYYQQSRFFSCTYTDTFLQLSVFSIRFIQIVIILLTIQLHFESSPVVELVHFADRKGLCVRNVRTPYMP